MNINEKDLLIAELLEIGNSIIDQSDSYSEVAKTFLEVKIGNMNLKLMKSLI